jgi:tetratricopeptide (TPR) repeat protein
MKTFRTLLSFAFFLSALCSSPAFAQQDFGEVAFANSGPAAAQADFLRGLAQLHSFEYDHAAEYFRIAQKLAPDFALAYWGEAMTQSHPVWHEEDVRAAREILKRLAPTPEARLAKASTEREKLYLRSVEVLFGDGTKQERDRRYESVLGELHRKFPDDLDGSAFYALSILGTAEQGRDFATYMRAAAVLEEVFPSHPRHPGVVHYLIHCYDDSIHAPLGLRAARIYAKIAPEAGHAQHMTSHIFLAIGMWDEEIAANETAMAVVNLERQKLGKAPAMCGHYNEWLEYGYLQQARVEDARRILNGCRKSAEEAAAVLADTKNPRHNQMSDSMMSGMSPAMMLVSSYAGMRSHFLVTTHLWNDDVAGWKAPPGDFPFPELDFAYADTLVALGRGDPAAAHDAFSRAESTAPRVRAWMAQLKMDMPAMTETVTITVDQLRAALLAAEGKPENAVRELQQTAAREDALPLEFGPPNIEKPTDEMLGELLLQLHRTTEAREAFHAALARNPGRKLVVDALARTDKEIAAAMDARKQPSADH